MSIQFQEFVGDFAMALNQSDSQDFVLEVIGVLGNLELPDLDYSQILHRCDLIPWIRNNLVPGKVFILQYYIRVTCTINVCIFKIIFLFKIGKAPDDLVLEIVIFLGTAAHDEDCARLLCKADMLLSLIELLKGLCHIKNV